MSLREQNKEEKRARLLEAARALFRERGYEATTTRELSQRAGVATGTLFLYFKDKEQLLLTLFQEEVDAVLAHAYATLPEGDVATRWGHVFLALFEGYARDPDLARVYVRELAWTTDPASHTYTLAFWIKLVEIADGALSDPQTSVFSAFAAYTLALTGWLSGALPRDQAEDLLRAALRQQLGPRSKEERP